MQSSRSEGIMQTLQTYLLPTYTSRQKGKKIEWRGNLIFCFQNVQKSDERDRAFSNAGRMDVFALQLQLIPAAPKKHSLELAVFILIGNFLPKPRCLVPAIVPFWLVWLSAPHTLCREGGVQSFQVFMLLSSQTAVKQEPKLWFCSHGPLSESLLEQRGIRL